ncbi:unnamed protein product, partial [Ixodes persulcatus]
MGVSGANLSPVGDGGDAALCDANRTREVDVRLGAVGVAPRHSTHPRTHTHLGAQSSAWTWEHKLFPRSAFRRYRSPAQTSRCVHLPAKSSRTLPRLGSEPSRGPHFPNSRGRPHSPSPKNKELFF